MTNPSSTKTAGTSGVAPLGPRHAGDVKAGQLLNNVRKSIGYHEGANNSNVYTKQVSGNANLPWCAAFVSVKLKEAGINGFSSSSCASLASQFRAAGKYTNSSKPPQPGDVIFFGSPEHHTGIVQKVENGKVYTVEGNSSDAVSERVYDLSNPGISGYGKVFSEPVSGDLGFDTSGATAGGAGGRPSGRSQGAGSAGRATSTGLDAGVYPAAYSHAWLMKLLLAILSGDAIGMLGALQELLPNISNEDLSMMVGALQDNPELASKFLADPEGTLEALKNAPDAEAVGALAKEPISKATPSEASKRLVKDLSSTDLSPIERAKLDKALETVPQGLRARGWQLPK